MKIKLHLLQSPTCPVELSYQLSCDAIHHPQVLAQELAYPLAFSVIDVSRYPVHTLDVVLRIVSVRVIVITALIACRIVAVASQPVVLCRIDDVRRAGSARVDPQAAIAILIVVEVLLPLLSLCGRGAPSVLAERGTRGRVCGSGALR